ncbi:hypothetical protein E1508_21610 [Pseudomonas moraviensis]|nr:hypothetical protein E1508_21610 [Pseudomonas moraviensis]
MGAKQLTVISILSECAISIVGASLLAKASGQAQPMAPDPPLSRASSLPQGHCDIGGEPASIVVWHVTSAAARLSMAL